MTSASVWFFPSRQQDAEPAVPVSKKKEQESGAGGGQVARDRGVTGMVTN